MNNLVYKLVYFKVYYDSLSHGGECKVFNKLSEAEFWIKCMTGKIKVIKVCEFTQTEEEIK